MDRPLDLLDSFDASDETLERLQRIADADLSTAKAAAIRAGLSSSDIDDIELELKRFFALPLLFPDDAGSIAPALEVDALWHAFILDTAAYRSFCDDVYDGFLDHVPDTEVASAGHSETTHQQALTTRLTSTTELLESAFGGPLSPRWDQSAWCGPCYAPAPIRGS